MPHILDNIIWNSIFEDKKSMSMHNGFVGLFHADIAPFAGLKNHDALHLKHLHSFIPPERVVVLFSLNKLEIPGNWQLLRFDHLEQMVCVRKIENNDDHKNQIIPLSESHVPQMLELTQRTKPGPFFERTHLFGNYMGIFEKNILAAMAGFRLQAGSFCEISAVCTHPDFLGKGYASRLLQNLIDKIETLGKIPFLHVLKSNTHAIKIYEHLGFEYRQSFNLYVLKKS